LSRRSSPRIPSHRVFERRDRIVGPGYHIDEGEGVHESKGDMDHAVRRDDLDTCVVYTLCCTVIYYRLVMHCTIASQVKSETPYQLSLSSISQVAMCIHVLTSEVSANDIMYMQARSSLSIYRPLSSYTSMVCPLRTAIAASDDPNNSTPLGLSIDLKELIQPNLDF
jgi:hypothetical protein